MRAALALRPLRTPFAARTLATSSRLQKKQEYPDPADKPVVAPDGQKFNADAFDMANKFDRAKGAVEGEYSQAQVANEEGSFANQRTTPNVNAEEDARLKEEVKKEKK